MHVFPSRRAGVDAHGSLRHLPPAHVRPLAVAATLVLGALLGSTTPTWAEGLASSASSAGSSASSAGSASLRGSSDSIHASSDSAKGDGKVAEGDYRVAAVGSVAGRPDMVRLAVRPLAAATGGFELYLPQRALDGRPLAPGDLISAHHRPYGIEFARGETRESFFLVLADDWQHDLQTRALAD